MLVATDVAARGVDVRAIGLVVNCDLPNEPEAYVHRIGRTARAGTDGRAVSFCSEEELEFLREIEKIIRMPIPRWDDHAWHIEALAERHARGKNASFSKTPKPSNNGGQGGRSRFHSRGLR